MPAKYVSFIFNGPILHAVLSAACCHYNVVCPSVCPSVCVAVYYGKTSHHYIISQKFMNIG